MNPQETQFKTFAETLFHPIHPPPQKSITVQLDLEKDADLQHFLYDLFGYGFRMKQRSPYAPRDQKEFFEYIRRYFWGIGFDVILVDYDLDQHGDVANINISFEVLK
jgi:hypothetical protein